jgi:hypothetical protein
VLNHALKHWRNDLTIYKQTVGQLLQTQSENLLLTSAIAA